MSKLRVLSGLIILTMIFSFANVSPAVAADPIVQFDATALALQNGETVTAWGGQSASGTPTYLTNQTPNGMPAVEFNGSDRMGNNVALPASAAGDWIAVAVIRPDNISAYHNLVDDEISRGPMLWINPTFGYELNFNYANPPAAGTGSGGWDIVIADSKLNQLYINSPTPNASGRSAIPYSATKLYDFFHRDGGQTYQGLVAEMRIYTDRADFGGDFAALYEEMVATYFVQPPLPKVALLGSEIDPRLTDIVNKVTAAGAGLYEVTNLSGCPLATPTLTTLQQYDTVMIWSDCVFDNSTSLGDVLADYVDGGGHVVVAAHVWWPQAFGALQTSDIRGRFAAGGYNPLNVGTSGVGAGGVFLAADDPGSPLLAGVNSLEVGSWDNTTSIAAGATLVAHTSAGNHPLVAYKGNVVALNFFPASSDAQAGFWNSTTDGARLMANALLFAGAPAIIDGDGDGVPDDQDAFPSDPNESVDTDGDSLGDNTDLCLSTPTGEAVDANGCSATQPLPNLLYVASINNDTIVRVDNAGNQSIFTAGGNIDVPAGLAFDASGNLYVASSGNDTVVRVDRFGNQSVFTAGGNIDGPLGLAFDASGNLFVSSFVNNSIVQVDGAGNQSVVTSGGNINVPRELAFNASGDLFVASQQAFAIVRVDSTGVQSVFTCCDQIDRPLGLAFDASGDLFVASFDNANIVQLDSTGNQSVFTAGGSIVNPTSVAFDASGNLFVASFGNHNIVRVNSAGVQSIFTSGGNINGAGAVAFPQLLLQPTDSDGDGVLDPLDAFPNDPTETTDSDGDGLGDNADTAPNNFNPDQSDLDTDGIADVIDPCPNDPTNTCDPTGSAAAYLDAATGGTLATVDGTTSISFPPGAAMQSSSVSITDLDNGSSGFELTTNRGKVLGVFAVDLQPSQTFNGPVTITFAWDDDDNDGRVDGVTAREDNLIITKDNVVLTGKCKDEPVGGNLPDCDTTANTFTFQVTSWSEFALAFVNDPVGTVITAPLAPVDINDQPIAISATFMDADDDDSHTAVWDWGNGVSSADTVDQSNNRVNGSYSYAQPGVYPVKLTLTDSYPNATEAIYQYVVVYDPVGGFVTGGGWIDSPEGACQFATCTAETIGKANFGFVAKYKKGQSTPDGNTQFQFKAGNLNFKSNSYEWLVVAGANAKFKGEGTINGAGSYNFMITARDGNLVGGGQPDAFRIKIWDAGGVVYDNQMGTGDDANGGTALGGGSIVIHSSNANAASVIAVDEPQTTDLLSQQIFLPLVSTE